MLYLVKRSLRAQILRQVGDGVTLDLHGGGVPGEAGGGGGIDAGGMVHKVGRKSGILDLGVLQISGELMNDGADHLQMAQFFCTTKRGKLEYFPGRFSGIFRSF